MGIILSRTVPCHTFQHYERIETCTQWPTSIWFIPLLPILIAHRTTQLEKKKKHISIFKANALVLIKAKQVTFKIQKIIVDTLKLKSCCLLILAPKVHNLLHYCVQSSTKTKYQLLKHKNEAYRYNQQYCTYFSQRFVL